MTRESNSEVQPAVDLSVIFAIAGKQRMFLWQRVWILEVLRRGDPAVVEVVVIEARGVMGVVGDLACARGSFSFKYKINFPTNPLR